VFSRNPGNSRKIPGKSPENLAGKLGVFSCFQAVIAYKCSKKQCFFEPSGDEFREIPEIPGNSGKFRGTNLCNFGKFGKSVPEKPCFLQNTLCAAGYTPGNSGGNSDIFGHFFSQNVKNLQKNAKKIAKKRKKCKKKHPEKHTEIFGGFSRKQGCGDLLKP
jgi:hypothetical protein